MLGPNKVEEVLAKRPCTRGWYQGIVNLEEQGIIGPFNFSLDQKDPNCVDGSIWRELEESDGVKSGSVDISDLNRITPLA
jgi:hypothetical protein